MSSTRTGRSRARTRAALAGATLLALTAGGTLAACGVTTDDDPRAEATISSSPDPTPSEPASDTATPTPSPSPSPSPTATVTVTESASPSARPTPGEPDAALLTAAQLPRLNDESAWTVRRTGAVSGTAFGLCQKFDALTIGATRGAERTFATGGDSAGQQVVDFPDAQNAVRASRVFEAWHRDCAGRVRGTAVQVRPLVAVSVPTGRAWWYLASFRRGGQGRFHAFGLAVVGQRMTLLRIDHVGQDHDYEPGRDPMELAVKAAAARLG